MALLDDAGGCPGQEAGTRERDVRQGHIDRAEPGSVNVATGLMIVNS
jgi:hypothetical protein